MRPALLKKCAYAVFALILACVCVHQELHSLEAHALEPSECCTGCLPTLLNSGCGQLQLTSLDLPVTEPVFTIGATRIAHRESPTVVLLSRGPPALRLQNMHW